MPLLRFDRFMEHALHHPTQGYYARKINTVGKKGDFSTTATLSNSLAKSIARWIIEERQHHEFQQTHIIEMGAGSGKLMLDVIKALPWRLRRKCQFSIVETSAPLREHQQKLLKKYKVSWFDDPAQALASKSGEALLYSNELVDAFPCRIFKNNDKAVKELHIDTKQRSEVFQATEELPESSFFHSNISGEKRRFEVHESYKHWLQQWLPKLTKGSLLTIDYGDEVENLLNDMPQGTLRGYLHHNCIRGGQIYQNVGHQDITADVNFTDLIQWAELHGLNTVSLSNQADFITNQSTKVDAFLTHNEGAGTAFKVLHQRKSD